MRLTPRQPYRFSLLLDVLARFPAPSLFTLRAGAYYRAFASGAEVALLRAMADDTTLHVEIIAQTGDVNEEVLIKQMARVLGVDVDLSAFYAFVAQHKALAHVVMQNHGLPVYRAESLYHALIYVIIEQHITWAAAQRAQQQLVRIAANDIEHQGNRHYAMPQPRQLAVLSVDDLKPLKITHRRMALLIQLSRQICDGELDYAAMQAMTAPDLYDALMQIKGVGHWTASVVVARYCGSFDYVPHNDVALQAAVALYFGKEKSANATKAHFAQYGGFAGTAAHFTIMQWVRDKYERLNH